MIIECILLVFRSPYEKCIVQVTKKTFHFGYKHQPVYAIWGTSRCLFSDTYKTNTEWAERTVFMSQRNQKVLKG
jgi:hypothetical protein